MNVEETLEKLRQAAEHYADCKGRLVYLQHYRNAVLSRLMEHSQEPTVTGREREALASEDYRNFLDGLAAATTDEVNAHWALKTMEIRIDVWRTKQATERVERRGYGT